MFLADVKDHWQHFEHGSDIGVRGLQLCPGQPADPDSSGRQVFATLLPDLSDATARPLNA